MQKVIGSDIEVNGDDVKYHTGTSTFYAGNGGETQLFVGYYEDEENPYNVSIEDGSKQYAQVDAKTFKDVLKAVASVSKKYKKNLLESKKSVNEGTDIYLNNRIQVTKFSGGKNGKLIQINAPKIQGSGDHIIMKIDDFKKMLKKSSNLLKQVQESVNEDYSSHYSPQVGLFYLEGVPFTKERIVEVIKYFRSAKIKSAVSQFEYRPTLLIKDKENNESVTIDARRLKTLIDFYKKDSAKLASDKDFK